MCLVSKTSPCILSHSLLLLIHQLLGYLPFLTTHWILPIHSVVREISLTPLMVRSLSIRATLAIQRGMYPDSIHHSRHSCLPSLFKFCMFVFSGQTSQSITRLKSTMVFRCRLLRRSLLHSLEKVGAEKVQHCRYVGRSFHVSLDPMGTCTHCTLISFSSIGSWPFVSMKLPVEQFPWTVTK